LFCGALTRAAEMFWSMKKSRERQNPSPIAPNTAPTDSVLKSGNEKMLSPRDPLKLFPTEAQKTYGSDTILSTSNQNYSYSCIYLYL